MLKKIVFILFVIVGLTFSLCSCDEPDEDVTPDDGDTSLEGESDENGDELGEENKDPDSDSNTDGGNNNNDNSSDSTEDGENSKDEEGEADNSVTEVSFVYSINSSKFHLPTCYHAKGMNEVTKVEFFGTLEEILEKGLDPCKVCKPDPDYDYSKSENEDETEDSGDTDDGYGYVINSESMKFHLAGCSSVGTMNEENKVYTNLTKEELIEQGYIPCGHCNP